MKIRSQALLNYLIQANVLNGSPEEVARAKREYRTLYKRLYKQRTRARKEIRFEVSPQQLSIIKSKATEYDMPHTTYARTVILAATNVRPFIVRKDDLLQVLQFISMVSIAITTNRLTHWEQARLLQQAEKILMDYLHLQTTNH